MGSEVELLHKFLRQDDPDAPLYGRYRREIFVDRFDRETSINFLKRGFGESGCSYREEELDDVVEHLDGIVGWLTYYGYYRTMMNMKHNNAVTKVFEEGSNLVYRGMEKADTAVPQKICRYSKSCG